jgi:hypothetical protein
LLEPIVYIPPAEAEANYRRQQAKASSASKPAQPAALQEGWAMSKWNNLGRLWWPLRGVAEILKIRIPKEVRPRWFDSSQQTSSKAGAIQRY